MRQNIIVSVISLLLISNLGATGVFATTGDGRVREAAIADVQGTEDAMSQNAAASIPAGASPAQKAAYEAVANESLGAGPTVVYVSEIIPGASCECQVGINKGTIGACGSDVNIAERKYKCTINPGLSNFQLMFAGIIRYLINIVLLLGVLAIAALGVAWAWAAGDDAKAKSALKKWGTNIVAGLIILFLFQYILHFIAPWIYK